MLTPNGSEQVVRETVRAYQPVPVSFAAQAGDRLLIRFEDDDRVLVLQVEAPSGLPWFSGVMPGPDGIDLWFEQAGVYRLLVMMSADAARSRALCQIRARPAAAPLSRRAAFLSRMNAKGGMK